MRPHELRRRLAVRLELPQPERAPRAAATGARRVPRRAGGSGGWAHAQRGGGRQCAGWRVAVVGGRSCVARR
eukprot:2580707-Prymnesium_polylepis.1